MVAELALEIRGQSAELGQDPAQYLQPRRILIHHLAQKEVQKHPGCTIGSSTRANLRSPSRYAVVGYAVSVKAEPIEET